MRFATLLLILISGPAAADDAISLKWSLKEGDKFFAKSDTVMDTTMTLAGQDIEVKLTVNGVQRFKVLSVSQDSTTVELTIVSMDLKAGGAAPIPGLDAMGERMKGATVSAVMDKNMSVKKVEGYDKFLDKLAGEDDAARKMMQAQFSESTISQMFSQVFSFGTDKPVKPGETWTRTEKMAVSGINATVKQKYKLDSVTNGVAKLGCTADVSFAPGASLPGLPPGVKVDNFDMKADKYGGKMSFDTKMGRLLESTQDADMTGSMSLAVGGMKIDVTMRIKVKGTTTISDKNPVKD